MSANLSAGYGRIVNGKMVRLTNEEIAALSPREKRELWIGAQGVGQRPMTQAQYDAIMKVEDN